MDEQDKFWMSKAISLARSAAELDEVPVGAVIVRDNQLVASGFNLREESSDPTSHAEIVAIRKACEAIGSWRLVDCTLYVTMEPCIMCSGAIVQSRLQRVVYGCSDPKGGGMGSLYDIHSDTRLNHQVSCTGGVLAEEASQVLKDFFKAKRLAKKSKPTIED